MIDFDREQASEYLGKLFGDAEGHVAVAVKGTDESWEERTFAWPDDRSRLLAWARDHTATANVFVCPALRSKGSRAKGDGKAMRWLWADVDWDKVPEARRERVQERIDKIGTYIVGSGTGDNVHVYVKLREEVSPAEHLMLNTGLRDHFYADNKQADSSLLRLPGTVNRKTADGSPVGVVGGHGKSVSAAKLRGLKAWANVRATRTDGVIGDWTPVDVSGVKIRWRRMARMSVDEGTGRYKKRHLAVNAVVKDLIKAGLSADQIHTLMNDFPCAIAKRDDEHFAYDVHKDIERIFRKNEDAKPQWKSTPKEITPESGRVRLVKASTFRLKRVQWGWQDRMPVGELCLIPGREGVGKSMFLAWLAAQITTGKLPGVFHGEPRPVAYVANEDAWEYTIAPRMIAAGADLDLVYNLEVDESDDVGMALSLPRDCAEVGELLTEIGAAALMLDPIVSVIDDTISVNQSRELRQALEPLRRMAERAQVMVPALAHFNKAGEVDVLSKIPGARAWSEVARSAIGIAQDEEEGHYVASQIKNNLGRLDLPHLTYTIQSEAIETDDGATDVGRLVWGEESSTSVQEIMSRKPERRGREPSENTQLVIERVGMQKWAWPVADIAAWFPEIKKGTVTRALERAYERGEIDKPQRGYYGPVGSVVKPGHTAPGSS